MMKQSQTPPEALLPQPIAPVKSYALSLAVQTLLICLPVLVAAIALSVWTTDLADIIFTAIADAYLQVSTFVAVTFLVFYSIEKILKIDAIGILRRATVWQVPIAAGLGALPGCGGAIIVITQYVTGRLSFGSVVAVLTATMGDAAFLLIAQEPLTGIAIMAMGFVVGSISGWIVNHLHGPDFLRQSGPAGEFHETHGSDASSGFLDRMWYLILIPGIVLAGLVAFQVDVDAMFASSFHQKPATLIGVVGGTLALAMRLAPHFGMAGDVGFSHSGGMLRRTVADTNFVTVWVIGAYLLFELTIHFTGVDLKALFDGWALFTPLMAIIIGFLPGCGPQVLVTTMYLAGYVPLSAQIGNAISNDGDALFPAIAIAPRVALVATLYSAVPALIISYGWFFIIE